MDRLRQTILLVVLLMAVTVIYSVSADESPFETIDDANTTHQIHIPLITDIPEITSCRYGVVGLSGNPGVPWLSTLGVGHFLNFTPYRNEGVPLNTSLLYVVRVRQEKDGDIYLPKATYTPPLTMEPDGLGPLVLANPGQVWIVGNEPDVPNIVQDNMLPSTYAWAYRDVYRFIKKLDPTAQVANAGLSMFTPGRREYMDIVWDTYLRTFGEPMPVDIWNMHLYILPEINPRTGANSDGKVALGTNPDLAYRAPDGPAHIECPKDGVICRAEHDSMEQFREQIMRMRRWMKNHGQQNKPLILSEFSLLYPFVDYDDPVNPSRCFLMDEYGNCFTQKRVSTYMQKTLDFLETTKDPNLGFPGDEFRLVQQWSWYSMWTKPNSTGSSSNILLDNYQNFEGGSSSAITQVGQAYRDRALGSEKRPNLVAAEATHVVVKAGPDGTADARIALDFYNSGSTVVFDPVIVTFFKDAALLDVIAGKLVSPEKAGVIPGCSWNNPTHRVETIWYDLPVGTHTYWAKVDPNNAIRGEVNEKDNVITGQVTVTP